MEASSWMNNRRGSQRTRSITGAQYLVCMPLHSSRSQLVCLCSRRHSSCRVLQVHQSSPWTGNTSRRSTVSCRSSSYSSTPPSKESIDQYLSIVSASSWQQLYNTFYDHRSVPSYQQCYGTLLQLLEVLPELQSHQEAGIIPAAAAEQYSTVNSSDAMSPQTFGQAGQEGSDSTSNGTTAGVRKDVWQVLAAAGKVQTASEVTALKSLIRDVMRAIQVQLHLFTPQELLDVLEAAVQLSQPTGLWLQAWEAAVQPQLKQLQLPQLMQAAEGLIHYGHKPSKPWAGVWFVALQPHITLCTQQQLAVTAFALKAWSCRPPLSWTEPYMESLQAVMSENNMSVAELLTVLGACVSQGLKPCEEWLKAYESASQGILRDCSPPQLASLLQGLQLLEHQASVEWLQVYLHAVGSELRAWDVRSLGSVLMVLGQQPAGPDTLQQHNSSSSSSSDSSSSSSNNTSSSRGGLLAAIVAHTETLIEQVTDPGALINLLSGYHAVKFTPPDEYLDLLLDETAARITANSADLLHRQQSQQQSSINSGSSSAEDTDGGNNPGNSRSSSSSPTTRDNPAPPGGGQSDEQLWLQAGSYKADRNISLGTARRQLESSWNINSLLDDTHQVNSRSSSWESSGLNAAAAAAAAPGVNGSMPASALVVGQVLQLLSVVADMGLPVERSWVAEVLGALKGHCVMVGLPELQLLLEVCQRFEVVLEPNLVDHILVKSRVDYTKLQPQDQLRLLSLLATSQTRPNNIWWQTFLVSLQQSLAAHTPAQLVMLLVALSDIGGRPPQVWLAAHESALLTNNTHSKQALSPEGWLLLLECYAQLMYQPSGEFESVFERYMAGVLGPHTRLSPAELASLVGSVGRMQLACSSQLEDGIISSIGQVLSQSTASELQQLVQGLLLLDLQLPSPTLYQLSEVVEPHLTTFAPSATCCLLQLLATAGEYPPSPGWLSQALAGLQPQLNSLEALGALMLLQSLKAFAARPPEHFMTALQQQLLRLVPKFDAMGVAAMLQGLAACGCMPSLELQLSLAGHIQKGLTRPSQGMGTTPLWLVLEVLVQVPMRAASPVLLDEVLGQAAQHLSLGSVTGSKMLHKLLPHLAAAVTYGGSWGSGYSPPSGFCDALCLATIQVPSLLSPTLWLDLLLRFSSEDVASFKPSGAWVQAAVNQVVSSWDVGQGLDAWSAAPADQLAAFLGALGRLAQTDLAVTSAVAVPGWPQDALVRLRKCFGELQSHQMVTALIGVSQLYTATQQAAAEVGRTTVSDSMISKSNDKSRHVSSSSRDHHGHLACVGDVQEWSSRTTAGIAFAAPELLAAAEAASLPKLDSMSGDELALLVHAMQQLDYVPSPTWVQHWAPAAAAQLPGASGQAGVMCLVAIAAYKAQPGQLLVQQVLNHCQKHLGELQLPELLALGRSLQLLGYKPEEGFIRSLARAGAARVDELGRSLGAGRSGKDGLGVAGADLRNTAMMELQAVLLGLQYQDDLS